VVAGLPLPAAPVLTLEGTDLFQPSTNPLPNTGGVLRLDGSEDGDVWYFVEPAAWEAVHSWGEAGVLGYTYYRGREAGGGVNYDGNGPWSEVLMI
jgi:hypothetical protein